MANLSDMSYGAESIQILEGLEAVRRRPGMYIGDTHDGSGLHHLVWEIVGNTIDEHLAGHASKLLVHVDNDVVTVEDDGRGISVDIVPSHGRPALEVILTKIHAGATFDGHTPHVHIGPMLHGVGLAVVNALSSHLQVDVWRKGLHYRMSFECGKITSPLTVVGKTNCTGTRICFRPDSEIFTRTAFDHPQISTRLQELTYLNPGLAATLNDHTFHSPRGLVDYVATLVGPVPKSVTNIAHLRGEALHVAVDVALAWGTTSHRLYSFVSQHRTNSGGTHVAGFWAGLQAALIETIPHLHNLSAAEIQAAVEPGLVAVVHAGLYDPSFGAPTKERLASPSATTAVARVVHEQLVAWLRDHPAVVARLAARFSPE
ncbi:MAG: ATP-binding protein [Nannocystaceae bacterium]